MKSSWKRLQDKHKGETGLVIGNGPSLNQIPLDFLRKYPTFGTNKIFLLDGFQPTYYCAVNPLVIEQVGNTICDIDYEAKFITAWYTQHLVTDGLPLNGSQYPSFSRTPHEWIYEGHTVTYVCLQLAFFMGFETVLLVGCDHRFARAGGSSRAAKPAQRPGKKSGLQALCAGRASLAGGALRGLARPLLHE